MENNVDEETTDEAYETSDEKLEPLSCTVDEDGDVNCVTSEENLKKIQQKGIKPKRLVLEVKD